MLPAIIEQALGPDVARIAEEIRARQDAGRRVDSEAWRSLFRLLASDQDVVTLSIGQRALLAVAERAAPVRACLSRIPSGRIGPVDLSRMACSYYEVWPLIVADLVRTGRADAAEAMLRSGHAVRDVLRAFYGIGMTEPVYDEAADVRAFRRLLVAARKRLSNSDRRIRRLRRTRLQELFLNFSNSGRGD